MATVAIAKIKIRRGTDAERKQITLDVGELGYVTDIASRRLFVGDGSTKGGNPAGIKFYTGNFSSPITLQTTQVGDLVFNTLDNKMYCLTGVDVNNFPNYSNPASYQFVGARTDNSSIEYSSTGFLRIKNSGVLPQHVDSSLFDTNNGINRTSPTGPISVKFDNQTIQVNGTGSLRVNPSMIGIGSLSANNQSIDASSLRFINLPSTNPLVSGRLWRDVSGNLKVS
ncbi:hypothetical protein EBU71_16890 [bacterium]|nr:hypothetical protein [Candidatus Elulimicrobium humile]